MSQKNTSRETAKSSEDRRIEVREVFLGDGKREVLLQEMNFCDGLGWYPQKTIRLDSDQVDSLLKQLCGQRAPRGCPGTRSSATRQAPPQIPEIIDLRDHLKG